MEENARARATPSEDWVRTAVIYQIFVRNFSSSGDLHSLQGRLDDLADLGVTVLWLMPIHPIGHKMRKGELGCPYAVKNYEEICSSLGTKQDLKALVQAAHERGMKLILDWVANHTSWDSHLLENQPHFFKKGKKKKQLPTSATHLDEQQVDVEPPRVVDDKEVTLDDVRERMKREREARATDTDQVGDDEELVILPPIEAWWDVAALDYGEADSEDEVGDDDDINQTDTSEVAIPVTPGKKQRKTEAQRALGDYMVRVMKAWVRDFDIDGFRCDVSEMVPTFFWRRLVREIKRDVKPSLLMLSEGALPEHHVGAFDLTYAWNVYDALTAIIVHRRQPASHLHDVLQAEALEYPEGTLRMRFITNHDKNFTDGSPLEHFGGAPAALAASVIAFTLGGYGSVRSVPMLYNGDEVGNTVRLSLFDRTLIPWEELTKSPTGQLFRRHYKTLIALRKRLRSILVDGPQAKVDTTHESVFAFVRTSEGGGDAQQQHDVGGHPRAVLVAVNLSEEAVCDVELVLPADHARPMGWRRAIDLYSSSDNTDAPEVTIDFRKEGKLCVPVLDAFGFVLLGLGEC